MDEAKGKATGGGGQEVKGKKEAGRVMGGTKWAWGLGEGEGRSWDLCKTSLHRKGLYERASLRPGGIRAFNHSIQVVSHLRIN